MKEAKTKNSKARILIMVSVCSLLFLFNCLAVYGATAEWTYTSPMSYGNVGFPLIYKNGYLYTFGGLTSLPAVNGGLCVTDINRAAVNSDGTLGVWQKIGDLDIPLGRNEAVLVGDKVYIVGGAEGYSSPELAQIRKITINSDGSIGTLSIESTQLNTARVDHSVVYSNGYIYAIGGVSQGSLLNSVEYAPINPDGTLGTWNYTQSLNTQRWLNQSITVNGYIYCLGGTSGSGYPQQAEFTQITTGGQLTPWQYTGDTMPSCWNTPGLVNIGNAIYAYGGWDSLGHDGTETIQAGINSDGTLQPWVTTSTNLNQGRSQMGSIAINNRLYALGGQSDNTGVQLFFNSVEYLDLNTTSTPPTGAGNALSFSGPADAGPGDVIEIPNSPTLTFVTTFSVEAWINPTQYGYGHVVSKDADDISGNNREWSIEFSDSGTFETLIYYGTTPDNHYARSAFALPLNIWTHVAGVYDGSSIYTYVNGQLAAVTADTSPIPDTGISMTIGNDANSHRPFNGTIDEVRVWNIARNQSQIQSSMNCPLVGNEQGLVGYWRFDEGSGQIAYDASGNGNNGYLGGSTTADSNDPTWVVSDAPLNCNSTTTTQNPPPPSGAGNALSFSGVPDAGPGDYVNIPDSSTLNFVTTFTVEAWINPAQYGYGHVVSKALDDPNGGGREWSIEFSDSGTFETLIYYLPQNPDYKYARSASAIPLNVWTHVAGVYDGSSIYTYVNGQLVAVTADTSPIPNTGVPLTIGNDYSDDRPFNGVIDEVRVWNVARSQSQLQSTMNCPLNGDELGLVGYWQFDEGSGQIAYDASGNGNNGQLGSTSGVDSNDPTWVVSDAPLNCNSTTTTNTQLPFIDFLVASDTGRFVYQVPPLLTGAGQPIVGWLPSYNGASGVLEIIFTGKNQGVNMTLEKSEWFGSESGQWYLLKAQVESNISFSNILSVGGVLFNGVPPGITDMNADVLISLKSNWALLLGYQESFENNSMYPQLMIRNNNYYPATVYIDYVQVKAIPAPPN